MSEHIKGTPSQRGISAINMTTANDVIDALTAALFEHRQDCRDKLCTPVEYAKMLNALEGEDLLRITLHAAIERLI